eukprot:CAMPEP_0197187902 /NCGR_PEP_ID=MMETSP1423-20130617/16821_1 /TAXON_ID=476441 /ORGANISM="Pseudo-nitzschia heimii, Strain UNC1101" /LENGTH=108 /DNA_ID=CAMNT_0042639605 /DNA_START=77 /DNA_END=400 /DNA_ORIENTATION=+
MPDDPKHDGSSDGTDDTFHDESRFLEDNEYAEETIEFDEVYGTPFVSSDTETAYPYDPFLEYAYVRKINGTDFVKKRRLSRRRSICAIACAMLLLATTASAFGIYELV